MTVTDPDFHDDGSFCDHAGDLREQLRLSVLRELRLREEQQRSWKKIVDLECDLADLRITLEELHNENRDLRRLAS